MAGRNETLLHPPLKPSLRRNDHLLARATLATAMAIGAVGATVWIASEPRDASDKPLPTEMQGVFPTPPALSEQEKKAINEVPLAGITKEQGVLTMAPFGNTVNVENPIGYSLAFQNGTIVAIEMDEINNSMWVALTMPGEKLTREETGVMVTNYDGTETELMNYKGLTAWVQLQNSVVSVFGNSEIGYQGLDRLKNNLKVGQAITVTSIINQDEANTKYKNMDLNSLSLLNNKEGKTNTRDNAEFIFKGDFVFL